MAFNLSKGDEPEATPKKTNFDLSKTDQVAGTEERKKKPVWLFVLAGLVALAVVGWYFNLQDAKKDVPDTQVMNSAHQDSLGKAPDTAGQPPAAAHNAKSSETTEIKPSDTAPTEAPIAAKPETAVKVQEATTLVAASFQAGSSQPQRPTAGVVADIRKRVKTAGTRIDVLGYASSEGPLVVNQAISQARADAYKRFLIKKGVADTAINALGKGIENPIAPNDTEEGRRKNRRVEVSFH